MLKEMDLLPVYDSSDHDLINDLIVPLLKNSMDYFRGVGFFTSGWLRLASEGLVDLIRNGGIAKIVLSPIMQKSDWEAFKLGEQAKENRTLRKILERSIDDLIHGLEKDTLNCMAWMISDGLLEFRFAITRDRHSGGDYHDKVGVFTDENGDVVAIHGSFNDTVKGTLNGEAFSVFKSWELGQYPYVKKHKERLLSLWNGRNQQFAVYTIPEASKHRFIDLRSTDKRPYDLPNPENVSNKVEYESHKANIKLRPYQEEAIKAWMQSNCKGIFAMATGTGKTFTSLSAASLQNDMKGQLALIILVPYIHLLEQWTNDCIKFGFSPILCSGEHGNWHQELRSKIEDFNLGIMKNICILAVHPTAASERFKRITKKLKPENTMIIGDEVHRLGSGILRTALLPQVSMRLGLSATPERWFDEEGTACLFSYFERICFEFSLNEAIAAKYLTPYDYNPVLVNLSQTEMDEYEDLTDKINMLTRMEDDGPNLEERLKILLLKRASIIAQAGEKIPSLLNILRKRNIEAEKNDSELQHILLYCAPGTHKEALLAVSQLGLRCHEFVHTVSLSNREKILKQFQRGDIQVLVAIKCLDEGVDVPATTIAFFLSSTSNPKEFIQRRGRILRLSDNKEKAIVYDFIVVPSPEVIFLKRDIDARLLKREMPRFVEFSSVASNEFQARRIIRDILDNYEMLNLLDEKPWDIYHKLRKNEQIDFES